MMPFDPTLRGRALLVLLALLPGCAAYAPLPLNRQAALPDSVARLDGAAALAPPLGLDDIGLLVLRNSPALRAARVRHGVAQAQLLAAGIPPNPSISASYGFLVSGPGSAAALSAGLSEDLKSLVTLSARRDAARASAQEVDASLLWQEWQTVGQGRLLAIDLIEGQRQEQVLQRTLDLLLDRLQRSRQALARGDTTLATVVPDLAAADDLRRQLDELQRQQQARRRDLAALLGLSPDAALPLVDHLDPAPVDAAAVRQLLPDLAERRPDLVALQLGYRAQEEKLRGAILAQFPTLSIGGAYARDNTDIGTAGPQISFELPLFDRNQGNIALERASRQQLHDEFGLRLATARSEVLAMLADIGLLQDQLAARRTQLAELDQAAARADAAFAAGDLDERGYVDLQLSRNTRQQEILVIEQTLLEQQQAIALLTGAGMPPVRLPQEST